MNLVQYTSACPRGYIAFIHVGHKGVVCVCVCVCVCVYTRFVSLSIICTVPFYCKWPLERQTRNERKIFLRFIAPLFC
jgi:hypothetical protein